MSESFNPNQSRTPLLLTEEFAARVGEFSVVRYMTHQDLQEESSIAAIVFPDIGYLPNPIEGSPSYDYEKFMYYLPLNSNHVLNVQPGLEDGAGVVSTGGYSDLIIPGLFIPRIPIPKNERTSEATMRDGDPMISGCARVPLKPGDVAVFRIPRAPDNSGYSIRINGSYQNSLRSNFWNNMVRNRSGKHSSFPNAVRYLIPLGADITDGQRE